MLRIDAGDRARYSPSSSLPPLLDAVGSGACRGPGAAAEQPGQVKPGADAGLTAAVAVKTAHVVHERVGDCPAAIPDR